LDKSTDVQFRYYFLPIVLDPEQFAVVISSDALNVHWSCGWM